MKTKGCINGLICELALWSTGNKNNKINVNLCFNKLNATVVFPNNDTIDHTLIEKWIEDAAYYDLHALVAFKKTELATKITTAHIRPTNGDLEIEFLSKLLKFMEIGSKVFQLTDIALLNSKSVTA